MNLNGFWTKYRDELSSDPMLVLALTAALVAFAMTPLAFVVLGRTRLVQSTAWTRPAAPRVLIHRGGHAACHGDPCDLCRARHQEPVVRSNRYEFDPNRTWSVLEQGRGFRSVQEADAEVRREMERLSLERKNLVDNVKKLDEAMLALRKVAGTSPAVAERFPTVLQSLAGVRKSVGLDGPQQLLDYTAPPADLRAMDSGGMGVRTGSQSMAAATDGGNAVVGANPPAPAVSAANASGLSPAEIEAELAAVPEPQRKIAGNVAALRPARRMDGREVR